MAPHQLMAANSPSQAPLPNSLALIGADIAAQLDSLFLLATRATNLADALGGPVPEADGHSNGIAPDSNVLERFSVLERDLSRGVTRLGAALNRLDQYLG